MDKIKLQIIHDEMNSCEFVTDVLMNVLGIEVTQAASCAIIIANRGEYVVRTFDSEDTEIAETILQLITNQGVPAKLI